MPSLYYSLRLVRLFWLSLLCFLVLGVQRACELVNPPAAPAVCYLPAPGSVGMPAFVLAAGPSLDRKRLAPSDSSRPAHPRQWRGFRGPAYHVGLWPRPDKVARDSAGRVLYAPGPAAL